MDMTPERYAEIAASIESEVGRVIVGQRDLVRSVLMCLLAEGHALLEGVPGVGKTMLLKTLSQVVDLEFSRIQFTPDLMPADIVGTQVLEEDEHGHRAFKFRPGPIFASFVLADEVNRATPKTQSALLEAMQERSVTAGGSTRMLPRPFLVMATQNPLEMEGTYPLPEAQLDRFLLKALVPFPSAEDLVTVLERTTGTANDQPSTVADSEMLQAMIALTRSVPIASHVARHAVDLVVASHPDSADAPTGIRTYVRFGRVASRGAGHRAGGQGPRPARRAAQRVDRRRARCGAGRSAPPPRGRLRSRRRREEHRRPHRRAARRRARTVGRGARSTVTSEPLLDPALLAQLERLQLHTRRRLAGRFAGEHRSTRYGSSLDFADYREYHPGDDYRRIDYPLYARTGQLFLRLFEAEDEVSLRLLVDVSGSMSHHGKLRQAAKLAAAMGFVALTRRDVVTLHLEPAVRPVRRFTGRHAATALFDDLSTLVADGGTDLRAAASDVLARPGPIGVTVVVSDLLTPTWEAAIDRLPARGGETVVLHVLAREEIEPDLVGDLEVVDAESGQVVPVSLSPDSLRDYRAVVQRWLDDAAARCRSRGAAYVRVMADDPIEDVLLRGWREQGVVR